MGRKLIKSCELFIIYIGMPYFFISGGYMLRISYNHPNIPFVSSGVIQIIIGYVFLLFLITDKINNDKTKPTINRTRRA